MKVVLTPFKVSDIFNVKDPIPKSLKSFVVYKFVCPSCNACNIAETTHHMSARIKNNNRKSHIFANLVNNETCKALSTEYFFEIIDSASTTFRLKEAIWKKSLPNKQQKYVTISINVRVSFIFNHYLHFTLSVSVIFYSLLLFLNI